VSTAAECFVDELKARGVGWIATLCGHGLDPLFDAAVRAGIRLVDTRNEQTAGYIADAAGRLTGKPGVCASSSGVAAANLFSGVMNAWFDHAPMLAITGSAGMSHLGMGSFQDVDQVALALPLTKYSRRIDTPARVLPILDAAWQTAAEAPHGPVHLEFPMDVQRAEVDRGAMVRSRASRCTYVLPAASRIDAVARELLTAERPLIVAGSGVFYSREGADLRAVAEAFSIPVQTPIWDRGSFDEPSDVFFGVVGAATGGPDLLGECDCLLLAGTVVDYRVGYAVRPARIGHFDTGWRALGDRLADFGRTRFGAWNGRAQQLHAANGDRIRDMAAQQRVSGLIHAADVVESIGRVLAPGGVLIIDGGSIGQWAHQMLASRRYPGHWLTCGRSGVVGYGIGGAMAARLCLPERAALLLSGDGAFTFNAAELECAVRQKLPFVAVVADDQRWGITHSGHLRQFGCTYATGLGSIRFDELARSLGARGVRVERPAELDGAIARALASGEVTVVHVPISGGNPA
jgi:acetolactate synthase-1/2/3 large subunit